MLVNLLLYSKHEPTTLFDDLDSLSLLAIVVVLSSLLPFSFTTLHLSGQLFSCVDLQSCLSTRLSICCFDVCQHTCQLAALMFVNMLVNLLLCNRHETNPHLIIMILLCCFPLLFSSLLTFFYISSAFFFSLRSVSPLSRFCLFSLVLYFVFLP